MKKFCMAVFYLTAFAILGLIIYGAAYAVLNKASLDSADYILFALAGAIFANIFKTFAE